MDEDLAGEQVEDEEPGEHLLVEMITTEEVDMIRTEATVDHEEDTTVITEEETDMTEVLVDTTMIITETETDTTETVTDRVTVDRVDTREMIRSPVQYQSMTDASHQSSSRGVPTPQTHPQSDSTRTRPGNNRAVNSRSSRITFS